MINEVLKILDPIKMKNLFLELENKLMYSKFPQEILKYKIEYTNFQDSYFIGFKLFNTSFNNQVYLER